jgi:uncharacterized peroxidase-related enzyme
MSKVPLIATAEAPARSREVLEETQAKLGMVPNLYRALAASPAALQGYVQLAATLGAGVLSAKTRESLAVAIAEANRCEYCLSAHTAIGRMVGLKDEAILQARDGKAEDPKLQAILHLARQMVRGRGTPPSGEFEAARAAGVTDAEFAEVAAHIGMHTFSNYFNNLVETDIDFPRVRLHPAGFAEDAMPHKHQTA